jgi:hypothetical protein
MKAPKEGDLVKAALSYLKLRYPDGVWWRNNVGAFAGEYKGRKRKGRKRFVRFGVPGMSDICGVFKGRAIFIECKTGTGKQSDKQRTFERAVVGAGARYTIIRSLEDLAIGDMGA